MMEIFFRYLHFIGIFGVVSSLVVEYILIRTELTASEVRRLAAVDAAYGISAVLVLVAGLTLWFWTGMPAAFYTGNPLFLLKVGAFLLVGLLSIYPTVFFLRHRSPVDAHVEVPALVARLIKTEIAILAFIPLLAVLMARGYGLD